MTRFRELRLQLGLSQEQLCRQYNEKYNRNYTAGAMSLIENDKRSPELGALLDFADFYGVSLDYLLGRDQMGQDNEEQGMGSYGRSWHLSEQLRNIVLGLYSGKKAGTWLRDGTVMESPSLSGSNVGKVQNLSECESASDQIGDAGRQYAMSELKRLENMSEAEENLEMLRYLLKQSVILAKRVEKSNKSWYRY
mgnify:FL=1